MTEEKSTIEKIYDTAARHFADYGIEGARMDKIALEAGVNKASIYYNVGNKEALYAFVMNRMFERQFTEFEKVIESDIPPEDKLAAYVSQIAKGFQQNPHIPKIIMREQVSQGRYMPESFVSNIVTILDSLSHILEEGSQKQVFEKADTLTIHFMILGTLTFHMTSAPIRRSKKNFTKKYLPASEPITDELVEKITQYILKAVKIRRKN